MTDRLYAATRKGLFTVDRSNGGWHISRVDFLGQNVTLLLHDPRDDTLYVALDHEHFGVKLHRSTDGGQNWEECAVPLYPKFTEEDDRKQAESGEMGARRDFSTLSEIWELTPGGNDQPGVLWAGTIPGGLFRSADCGTLWELVRSLWDREERWRWFGGGKDSPGIHTVTVHPTNSQHLTVAVLLWQSPVAEYGSAKRVGRFGSLAPMACERNMFRRKRLVILISRTRTDWLNAGRIPMSCGCNTTMGFFDQPIAVDRGRSCKMCSRRVLVLPSSLIPMTHKRHGSYRA